MILFSDDKQTEKSEATPLLPGQVPIESEGDTSVHDRIEKNSAQESPSDILQVSYLSFFHTMVRECNAGKQDRTRNEENL